MPTRPSRRAGKPTLTANQPSHGTNKTVARLTATTTIQSTPAPDWAKFFIIRNDDGTKALAFNFNGNTTNYWTLKPGECLNVPIPLNKGEELHYLNLGADTLKFEIILWG